MLLILVPRVFRLQFEKVRVGRKADLRGLLYDVNRWNGDGVIDLPVNPIAWRPYNGSKGNAARIGLPSRLARRQDLVLPP